MRVTPLRKTLMSSKSTVDVSKEAKKALRQSIKSRLAGLSEEDISHQSNAAQKAVLALPQYERAKRISIYLSMPTGETRTEKLVRDALNRGKVVFVPYIYKTAAKKGLSSGSDASKAQPRRSVMEMLRLTSIEDWEGLKLDSWGIPSLNPETLQTRENVEGGRGLLWNDRQIGEAERVHEADADESEGLDMVVVPGVAFDRGMNRLGHGAGFYDSYLSRFCSPGKSRKKPFLVGLCLAEQLVAGTGDIPVTDHDWQVDAIAVGDGSVVTSANTV